MRLGCIDYLNCYPFYFHMLEREPVKGVSIFMGYPNVLNKMLADCELDMSSVSAATCADIGDEVAILPEFCLSSVGYVGSVTLSSKVPIEELHNKRIGITSASHTSVVLLKILLEKFYKLKPIYIKTDPRPRMGNNAATLTIGNDAMVKMAEPISYIYDLGDLWLRKTGFPVVFAVFGVRKSIVKKYESEIRAVVSSYYNSLGCLEKERERVVLKAEEKYPDIIYNVNDYYSLLKFEFTRDLKDALMYYYTLAGEMGLVKKVTELEYIDL